MAQGTYPSPAEREIISRVEALMEETMKYDPSHDAFHVRRVRRTALTIARTLDPVPDLLVVELASLMHDLLDKKYVHADIAADPYAFSKAVLSPIGGVYAEIDLIRDGRALTISKIIDSVSWTTEKRLRADSKWGEWHDSCLELHCVQDADRLDAIGAFGIMRCAAFSSVMNRPLFVPPEDESDREAESAIAHFHDKLLQIKDRLKTEAGKRMGEERHDFMLDFLNAVDKEYYAPD